MTKAGKPRHVGFTGSSRPLPQVQVASVREVLSYLMTSGYQWLHHGDCVNGDTEAHMIAVALGMSTWGHPPDIGAKRAYCACNMLEPELPYLTRNHALVRATVALVAAPGQPCQVARSGTWATVRYARKLARPLYLVLPSGAVSREN